MTSAHQFAAVAAGALTVGLVAAAAWSWWAGRSSAGGSDHRFLVDRLVIGTVLAILVAAGVGLAIVAAGGRPADALHLLYGALAAITVPVAWALAGRPVPERGPIRRRRDAWVALAGLVLLGIEARLFMTG